MGGEHDWSFDVEYFRKDDGGVTACSSKIYPLLTYYPDIETGFGPEPGQIWVHGELTDSSLQQTDPFLFPRLPPLSHNHDKSHFNIQQPWETEAF